MTHRANHILSKLYHYTQKKQPGEKIIDPNKGEQLKKKKRSDDNKRDLRKHNTGDKVS